MASLTLRETKGLPLSYSEVDANFTNLNTTKYEDNYPIVAATIECAGMATFLGNASITGNLALGGNLTLTGILTLTGATSLSTLAVSGLSQFNGNVEFNSTITTDLTVAGDVSVSSDLTVNQTATVDGAVTLNDTLTVDGATEVTDTLTVTTGGSITADAGADDLLVRGTGDVGVTIGSGNANNGSVNFADTDSNTVGRIVYNHSTNEIEIYKNGSLYLTIGDKLTISDASYETQVTADDDIPNKKYVDDAVIDSAGPTAFTAF